MTTTQINVNPDAIRAQATKKPGAVASRAGFDDILGGISAMGPAAAELTAQWTGGSNMAGAVLSAAFSGIEAAGSTGVGGGYGAYASSPGVFGAPRYTTQTPVYGNASRGAADPTIPGMRAGTGPNAEDPAQYQYEIMQTMNSNNLKLLELQALMQSNMQAWTTKSNILAADHKNRMGMMEKFNPRAA